MKAERRGAARLSHHVFAELLPLWHERGVDRERGGFHNRLLAGSLLPAPDPTKRLLVQARMTWSFAHAAALGGPALCLEAAQHGYAFLTDRFRDRRCGGWYLTATAEGAPLDRRKDLYAHAFVLLALAAFTRATGERAPLALANETMDLLEKKLVDPEHGGFFDDADESWTPRRESRRQNPHMHLLEACLALEATGHGSRWGEAARRLHGLFSRRLRDPATGTLGEHFARDWSPAPGLAGQSVEPGHHYEWTWLLCALGDRREAEALFAFAERHGLARDVFVVDEVDRQGRVRRATRRLWPQLERIQALAALGLRESLEEALGRAFERYWSPERRVWREHLDAEGRDVVDFHPATSVYHVVQALSDASAALESAPGSPDSRAS
jgi:mannose/cellobiose epimerase-like protein (N-acyl-D-glucosamine 2-epimerase family)